MPAEPLSPAQVLVMLLEIGFSVEDYNKMFKIFVPSFNSPKHLNNGLFTRGGVQQIRRIHNQKFFMSKESNNKNYVK